MRVFASCFVGFLGVKFTLRQWSVLLWLCEYQNPCRLMIPLLICFPAYTGVDPRDRMPFVGLDLCISRGIRYLQGAYLCRVRPLRRRLRSNPYKGAGFIYKAADDIIGI